ncbi:MAG: hypothetical protein OIF47_05225 [Marinibacterium sp.]|nr:hypothetical protein [Marinibacterium sp.]
MRLGLMFLVLALGGCAQIGGLFGPAGDPASGATDAPAAAVVTPAAVPDRSPVPTTGRSVDSLDTTTEAERSAAAAPAAGGGRLGQVVAGLGDPSKPGIWLETPLVDREQPGRATDRASGASVQLTLIPIPDSGGSRLSLAAMRVLDAPLSELVELDVFTGG